MKTTTINSKRFGSMTIRARDRADFDTMLQGLADNRTSSRSMWNQLKDAFAIDTKPKAARPSLAQALLETFGGGRAKVKGYLGRGGHTEVAFKGVVPASVRATTKQIKAAMKLAGYKSQGRDLFATRNLDDAGGVQWYVERGEDMVVISLEGTVKRPLLIIE